MEYKTDAEMDELRKYWGGSSMGWKYKDSANDPASRMPDNTTRDDFIKARFMDRPKPTEYVKLDDVIALFVADMDHLDADRKEIVGDNVRAQIQRTMADSLKKHSSSLMTIALNKLKRYEF